MANFNCNKLFLGGRLTADVELKQTQSGIPVCTFSIAVKRKYGGEQGKEPPTDFFNVTAWHQTAEFISKYFRKGSSIFIVGELQNRSWTDQQGNKRYATDVIAHEASFVDSRADADTGAQDAGAGTYIPDAYNAPQAAPTATPQAHQKASTVENVQRDDDLPF